MALREECERQGNLLFRWRSYIPLLLIIITIPAFEEYLHFNHLHDFPWELGALILSFIGEFIRILTVSFVPKGTSGRVTKHQEAQKLNKLAFTQLLDTHFILAII